MPRRIRSTMMMVGALLVSAASVTPLCRAQNPAPATQPSEPVVNRALAERVGSMAMALLRAPELTQTQWQYAAALLDAAARLDPANPRFPRYVVEASSRAGDGDNAVRALHDYLKLRPDDEFAQVELMEFYLGRMEQSDAKLKYLTQLLESQRLPAEVRSVAAVRAAQVQAERMQHEQAHALVDQALKLNPLNLEALRIFYSSRTPARPDARLAILLHMLRVNPAQPHIGISIARELADVGLAQRSLDWFEQSLDLHRKMGIAPPPDVGLDYAAQLFIVGDPRRANQVVDLLLQQNQDDLNAWLMKLILARHAGDKPKLDAAIQQVNVVLSNRLANIRKESGDESATTRPVTDTQEIAFPDPQAELQRLVSMQRTDLVPQLASVASALAWEKIYFEQKPAPAQSWINALSAVMRPDDDVLVRLQGWSYLVAGNKDEARARLQTVADTDPVAALGLVQLAEDSPEAQEKATQLGKEILARKPSGLTGALVLEALSKRDVKVAVGPLAGEVDKVLSAFPREWMRILDQPQQFYRLILEPVAGKVGVLVGEPVLVQVTIQNIGQFDLALGPDGVIRQDLWLDAQLRGAQQQVFPAEAYQRFGGPLVLRPNESLTQVVRLDQRALAMLLEYPITSFQIAAVVITNPTTIGGNITIGPAGNRATLNKLIERTGAPVGQPQVQQRLMLDLQNGTPEEKVRALEIWAKLARLLAGQNDESARQLVSQGIEAVHTATTDPDPAVRAWALYLYSVLTGNKENASLMLQDSLWLNRALGVIVTDYVDAPRDAFKEMAQNDADPLVKRLASAAAVAPIFKQPTTAPATEPAAPAPAVTTTAEPAANTQPPTAPAPTELPPQTPEPAAPQDLTSPPAATPAAPEPPAAPPINPIPESPAPLAPPGQPEAVPTTPAPAPEAPAPAPPAPPEPTSPGPPAPSEPAIPPPPEIPPPPPE